MRNSSRSVLLRDRGLVAHSLPVPGAAHPHPGVAIGTAEIFAELVTLHVCPGGHNGGVAVDAYYHIADIDGFIAKLATLPSGQRVLFRRHLTERRDGDVVLSQGSLGEIRVAAEAGLFGLPFHLHDLADCGLVA